MNYWAQPVVARDQIQLFPPTMDELVPADHPVRLYYELLSSLDWSEWEARYNGRRGQPPIHPLILCTSILYGLNRGIRSSRQLEDACRNRVDYMWLVERREIDHSTFANFRRKYGKELKDVFKQVSHIALKMGYITLEEVATDGTQVKSSNSRYNTSTAKKIAKRLEELEKEFEEVLQEVGRVDRKEDTLFGPVASSQKLPEKLQKLEKRREELNKALEEVKELDAARKKRGGERARKPAQVPLADPDSHVLENKDGGYAPNFTPMASTDGKEGFIVDEDVINHSSEATVQQEAVERIEETFKKCPDTVMGDGAYATSQNVVAMEDKGVELLSPVKISEPAADSPVIREDLTEAVQEEEWDKLPISKHTKKLDRSAFVYVEIGDCYFCPMGRELKYKEKKDDYRLTGKVTYKIYQCESCEGCPLADRCQSSPSNARTVRRDINEESRIKVAERMAEEETKTRYNRRSWIAETPFAYIKQVMGIRQFLMRGLKHVKDEWCWICTAHNLGKLVRLIGAVRLQEAAR
jgi:transposase